MYFRKFATLAKVIDHFDGSAKILPYWTHDYQPQFNLTADVWTFEPEFNSQGLKYSDFL